MEKPKPRSMSAYTESGRRPAIEPEYAVLSLAEKKIRKSSKPKNPKRSVETDFKHHLSPSTTSIGTMESLTNKSSARSNKNVMGSDEYRKKNSGDNRPRPPADDDEGRKKRGSSSGAIVGRELQSECSEPRAISSKQNKSPPAMELSVKNLIRNTEVVDKVDNLARSLMTLFNSDSSNKICADCRTPLLEINRVYCSFYARNFLPDVGLCSIEKYNRIQLSKRKNGKATVAHSPVEDNKTPPSISFSPSVVAQLDNDSGNKVKSERELPKKGKDNYVTPLPKDGKKTVGKESAFPRPPLHGVFICQECSVAHTRLGNHTTVVDSLASLMSADETSILSSDAITIIIAAKGNSINNAFLEHSVSRDWKDRRPNRQSSLDQREVFARAKYQVLAFAFLRGSVDVNDSAWNKILSGKSGTASVQTCNIRMAAPPDRLIDYFCIVGPTANENLDAPITSFILTKSSIELAESILQENAPPLNKMEVQTTVYQSYPLVPHRDTPRPSQLTKFAFPDGCTISTYEQPPRYFGFVLTLETGLRLYGHVLVVYETSERTTDVLDVLAAQTERAKSNQLLNSYHNNKTNETSRTDHAKFIKDHPLLFLPKAIVLISHYPFHNSLRLSLLNLYRISLVEAPVPIERYIANLVSEVPLPPRGIVRVRYSLSAELPLVEFERAPLNELPMANFSYRPLFSTLSVSNVLVIFGLLVQETSIVLCSSESVSLLFLVSEALTSLLFPLVWQGAYIPVLPREMLDVLHAPVPFLVGVHGPYLKEVPSELRPPGVVFVDLDNDEIHLGVMIDGKGEIFGRSIPALPKKAALKLRSSVEKSVGNCYLATKSGIKGRVTYGYGSVMDNNVREEYAYELTTASTKINGQGRAAGSVGDKNSSRAMVLKIMDDAYPNEEHLMPIGNFLGEDGSKMVLEVGNPSELSKKLKSKRGGTVASDSVASKLLWARRSKGKNAKVQGSAAENTTNDFSSLGESCHGGLALVDSLLDVSLDESEEFSASAVRMTFLKFFTSTLSEYDNYIQGKGIFDQEGFLKSIPRQYPQYLEFLSSMLDSQMFRCLIEEKVSNPSQPEIQLFDESIIAKKNRSRKTIGKKTETPFLTDVSQKIREVYVPPQPSNLGLPDDGTSYCYASGFPVCLEENLYGSLRPIKKWITDDLSPESVQRRLLVNSVEKVNYLLAGALSSNSAVKDFPERDVVWAIYVMASKNLRVENPRNMIASSVKHIASTDKKEINKIQSTDGDQSITILSKTMLPVATTLLDSARRKQRKHVRSVIRMQCIARICLARMKYKTRIAAIFIFQRAMRIALLRRRYGKGISLLYCLSRVIQRVSRGHIARQHFRRMISLVVVIQSNIRMWMYRKYLSFLIQWSVVLQARFRGRRSRIGYKCVLEVIACLQSSVRAWHTIRVWARFRQQRIIKYRRQIFELWERAFRPLIFRAKFWTFYQGMYDFRHLAIHEDELIRLWVYLGLRPLHTHHRGSIFDSVRSSLGAGINNDLDLGLHMGWRSQEVYHRFTIVQKKLDILRAPEGNLLTPTFPEEIKYATGASEKLFVARKQLMIEQAEIYEKLKFQTSEETLYHIYELFHIPRKDKEKKKIVVDMLWRKHSLIAASCEVVLMKGINMDCKKRSKRARKLYDTRNQQGTITEDLNARSNEWVRERYEKRMRDDITASSQALFSSVLNLLESGYKHASNNLVIKRCHTRAEIIRKYLSCDQYGNSNCIRRTAVRLRQPKKKRNVGVQDLVDKGFEISCVSDVSLETSITSY